MKSLSNSHQTRSNTLNRPLRGQGGYQSLLARLQSNMCGTRLRLTLEDCEKVVRYATQYGQGGFQERLRSIVRVAEQTLDRHRDNGDN